MRTGDGGDVSQHHWRFYRVSPSKKRRVVIVDPSTAPTGALRGAINIARALIPDTPSLLVLATSARVDDVDLSMFDDVVRLPMRQIRRSPIDLALYGPNLLAAGFRLRRLLRDDDILIINDFYLLHGWLLRRMNFRGRIVTWVRIDPLAFPTALRRIWTNAMCAASDAIVAVSEFIVERLRAEGVVASLLYDPVDPLLMPIDTLPTETQRIVQIANFTRGKGQNDAIAAFARIASRFPQARLAFYGGDMALQRNRDYQAELERQAEATGYGDRIAFHGYARDIGAVLADASLALVLSHRESFSLACLEASGCGVPVIATRCGGPEEIVQDGITGMLCTVGDVPGIAVAMERLLGDPMDAIAMGLRGAVSVATRFSTDVFSARLRNLLLCDPRNGGSAGTLVDAGSSD